MLWVGLAWGAADADPVIEPEMFTIFAGPRVQFNWLNVSCGGRHTCALKEVSGGIGGEYGSDWCRGETPLLLGPE